MNLINCVVCSNQISQTDIDELTKLRTLLPRLPEIDNCIRCLEFEILERDKKFEN